MEENEEIEENPKKKFFTKERLKTIENSLVHIAQGYFIHIFICCDNLLM